MNFPHQALLSKCIDTYDGSRIWVSLLTEFSELPTALEVWSELRMGYREFSRRINECVGSLFLSPRLDFGYFRINEVASCLKRDLTCEKQLSRGTRIGR